MLKKDVDTMERLSMIKKLVYTGGTNDLNRSHNKAMCHMNLTNLHQDRSRDIQEFLDHYVTTK